MPVAEVHVLAGHDEATLAELLREVSATAADTLGMPIERVQVWINEIPLHLYSIAGQPANTVITPENRAELEMPFIRLVSIDSRPVDKVQGAIAALSATVARVLGSDPARVRVQTVWAQAEVWGVGGVPLSLVGHPTAAAR